jgi:hypothetical protein
MKLLEPHRLGAFTACVAAAGILLSALAPGQMPELPLGSGGM